MRMKLSTISMLVVLSAFLFVSASPVSASGIPQGWQQVGADGLVDGTVVPGSQYDEKPARNNSYAWSMGTLECENGEYLYVGSYRNFPHGSFLGGMLPIPIPDEVLGEDLPPKNTWDMGTVEIMRKNITLDGDWETVDLPAEVGDFSGNQGFRKMYNYNGVLYAGTMNMKRSSSESFPLDWDGVPRIIAISDCSSMPVDVTPEINSCGLEENKAYSYRGMVEHDGVFYVAWEHGVFSSNSPITKDSWESLAEGWDGYITDLVSFDGSLWAITSDGEHGWGLFKWVPEPGLPMEPSDSEGSSSEFIIAGQWTDYTPDRKQSIHVGANGFVYDDHLYIATLNGGFPLYDINLLSADTQTLLERLLLFMVPSYLYRFDGESEWETVMGDGTGLKAPGFGVPTNVYLWTWGIHNDDLYISTFDWRSFLYYLNWDMLLSIPTEENVMVDVLRNLADVHIRALCTQLDIQLPPQPTLSDIVHAFAEHGSPVGFDLYKSEDGLNFETVMRDGFGDHMQHGGRTMITTNTDGKETLWLGTSNAGNGCQVWKYQEDPFPTNTEGYYPDPEGIRYVVSVTPCSEDNNGEVSGDIREPSVDVDSLLPDSFDGSDAVFFELELLNPDDICMVQLCGFFNEEDQDWLPETRPNLWWHDGSSWNELAVTWTDLGDGEWRACAELPEESWTAPFGAALDNGIFTADPAPGNIDDSSRHHSGSGGCNIGIAPSMMLLLAPFALLLLKK